MPHLFLEYTENIQETPDFPKLFDRCHEHLAQIADADPKSCKSRVFKEDVYHIGSGDPKSAFIHLCVYMANGRTPQVKKELVIRNRKFCYSF
ncbi:MAG: hypothetical protein SNF33_08320 [Candidatus Algichlamydia australiensis]|nr:hypothetical protein [Chlamydiales bacterium]